MGLLGEVLNSTKNAISQGIQGAKAIIPYVNDKCTGLVSAVKNNYNGFIDTVKSIPSLFNNILHFRTFANDVNNGMNFAAEKRRQEKLYGIPHESYMKDVKDGYQASKEIRTNPIVYTNFRRHKGLPEELPYDKEKQKQLDRINQLRKITNIRRMTIADDVRLSLNKKRNRKKV